MHYFTVCKHPSECRVGLATPGAYKLTSCRRLQSGAFLVRLDHAIARHAGVVFSNVADTIVPAKKLYFRVDDVDSNLKTLHGLVRDSAYEVVSKRRLENGQVLVSARRKTFAHLLRLCRGMRSVPLVAAA